MQITRSHCIQNANLLLFAITLCLFCSSHRVANTENHSENYDIEWLIMAVEKRTCLCDTGSEGYHDRQMKDLAWEDVCIEILEEA
ncbi:unnamed protein product [Parnassius mnemosyne]|uniref:MADF domain-containing protein n=1 Tax=Parnassius mnemosyne TaxID=213953 RepID=A0AAV1L2S7_9NEOP